MLSIMSWLMRVNNRSKYFISWEIYVPISSIFCTINKRTLPCCCVKRKSHLQIQSTMLCYISIRPQEHWTVWTCPSHSFDYLYLKKRRCLLVLTKSKNKDILRPNISIKRPPMIITPTCPSNQIAICLPLMYSVTKQ